MVFELIIDIIGTFLLDLFIDFGYETSLNKDKPTPLRIILIILMITAHLFVFGIIFTLGLSLIIKDNMFGVALIIVSIVLLITTIYKVYKDIQFKKQEILKLAKKR